MADSAASRRAVSVTGWNSRLYLLWILYNTIAFIVILTIVFGLTKLGTDVLRLTLASSHTVAALLVATFGAVLFGGVLGALQWLVVRERVPVARRSWIVANIVPALFGWLLVILPAGIEAQKSHRDASVAYLVAASQTLALGPLLGLSQSLVLRKVTHRWAWWIAANLSSWLIVDAGIFLLSRLFGALNVLREHGSVAEVYLALIATAPLTGRMLLWVLAPAVLVTQPEQAS